MRKRSSDATDAKRLRKRAEERLAHDQPLQPSFLDQMQLVQELEIHRIELELQNEELRRTHAELATGLDRYTQLFDFAPIGYATLAREGTVLQVNHVGATLLGKNRREVVGRPFVFFLAREHTARFKQLLRSVLTENEKRSCEVEVSSESSEKTTLRLTADTLTAREPTVLVAFEDISIQKRTEAALLRADDQLRDADRRKDEFLAVLSHELRTPLSSLLLHAQLLQRGKIEEAGVRRTGAAIERAARAQQRLVEDLLDVSRIIAGKLSLKHECVELEATVRAAVEAVAGEAKKRSIDVSIALDRSVLPVIGDSNRLEQAVWNLLSNAIKFTPPGGRIDVTLRQVDGRALIRVRDTGAGIDPEFLPYLFVRFTQADRTATRSAGGLGLGLSIAHSIVQAHEGDLCAESAGRGKGSTFTITLPTTAARNARSYRSVSPKAHVRASIQGARLLIVEDDAGTRATLTEVLEQAGAKVRDAEGAAAAMRMLDQFEPDVIVCDLAMPEEDGCSLLRRIRERRGEGGADVPAVALTAFAGDEVRARTKAAGFQEHLVKPVNIDQLIAAVADLLPRSNDPGRAPQHA
jgi:PAS domain S-box-containing protein